MKLAKFIFFLATCFLFVGFFASNSYATIYTVKAGVLTDSAGGSSQRKLVRTSNGDLHTVYHRSDGTYQQVYYAKSIDSGATWNETQLTNEIYAQNRPSVAVDSNDNLHVVWYGKDDLSTGFSQVRYIKFSGGSWGSITDLTTGNYDQLAAFIAVDSNDNLHVVWYGKDDLSTGFTQIRYIKYSSNSWGSVADLTSGDYDQSRPFLGFDYLGNIHLVWSGKSAGSPSVPQIRYLKYTTGWSDISDLTSGSYTENYPVLASDSQNNIHAAWQSGVGGSGSQSMQLVYKKYTASTDDWSSPTYLTSGSVPSPGGNWNPFVAIDSNDYVHIAWNANYTGSGMSSYQIRYIKYTDTWGDIQNMTTDSNSNAHPNLIWFASPTINGAKVNRPKEGFAFVWAAGTTFKIYVSDDLSWDIPVYSVGGTATGLSGSVVLQNSGGNDLSVISSGAFSFSTSLISGSSYDVTVLTQPDGQTCVVSNGSGIIASVPVDNVVVTCTDNVTPAPDPVPKMSLGVSGGGSVQSRANNLVAVGNLDGAVALMNEYYGIFPKETPVPDAPMTVSVTAPGVYSGSLNQNLSFGSQGLEVKILQQYLNRTGFVVNAEGPGSVNNETTTFGPATRRALVRFQKATGIEPALGFFGPITRKYIYSH